MFPHVRSTFRKRFLDFGLLARSRFVSLAALVCGAVLSAADRPNIILIMTDDQGYGDLGVMGNPVVDTPNIDRLAQEGASLATFLVSPVCAPTRASLMTGRYHFRTGVIDTWKGRAMMDPEEVTVAEVLREAGYATGIFGKWHLGDCYPMRAMDQGFEESLVHRGGGLAQPSEPIENKRRYTDPILFHNGEKVSTTGYCTDVYFDAAMGFIDRAQSEGRPFFIYLPPNAPHGPFHDVPESLYEKYRSKDLSKVLLGNQKDADVVARVFAMVENIDQNVGRLVDKLDTDGLLQNTLIVFLVDNGPNTRRFVGPLRGKKSEVQEGGIRSPFIAHWPARLEAGASSDRLSAHIDIMPTLLEAAGVAPPAGLELDGRSALPLLDGRQVEWPDRYLFAQAHRGDLPVAYHNAAVRNQRWKLAHPTGFQKPSSDEDSETPFELYDLAHDPGEERNLISERPDVARELRTAYDDWFEEVGASDPENFAPLRIIVGTDHETETVLTRQDWRVKDGEGWGRDGRWYLRFAGEHDYDVELLWPEPIEPASVVLTIGSLSRTVELNRPSDRIVIRDLRLPAGDAELRVAVNRDGVPGEAYHVVLLRQ